ncbi:MAG TPA: alpha/beta fold hydrolase [Stellaceae bacterium]
MPRPLPAHLASAMVLWLSSRAGLTSLPGGLPRSNTQGDSPGNAALGRLAALAAEIGLLGPDAVAAALDRQLRGRAEAFLAGIEAYRGHPFHRGAARVPVRWRHGAARLLDYGKDSGGPAVVIVPSLINRHYIVDLLRERSFVRHLAREGLRPLVLDWGEPGPAERDFTLSDYISGPLTEAVSAAVALTGGPVAVCGYCMGGLLALALALRRPADTKCLALLATPWDFHAERRAEAELLGSVMEFLPVFCGASDPVPVSVIQGLFMALDPFLAERKFIRFAGLDPEGEAARGFVALEDWINDGVPLARQVALECAHCWYRDNDPAQGRWQVAGRPVRPQEVTAPTLVVLPSRDRIVPPRSAEPLAAAIPHAAVLRPPSGHIGMMASPAAPRAVWQPISEWLRAQFA